MTRPNPRRAKSVVRAERARRSPPAPRAWQRMLSGRRLDLLDPSPMDVEIEDIAHGLARLARWNGQTSGSHAFSVAQHSVIVEMITGLMRPKLPAAARLTALLHDAPEYVVGDMISPFKAALGVDYHDFEDHLLAAILIRFGLAPRVPVELKRTIKRADRISAYFEAIQLAGFEDEEARRFFGSPPDGIIFELSPHPPEQAQAEFLARFEALIAEIETGAAGKNAK